MSEWKNMDELPKDGRKIIVIKPLLGKEGCILEVLKDFDMGSGFYRDSYRNGSPILWTDYDDGFFPWLK